MVTRLERSNRPLASALYRLVVAFHAIAWYGKSCVCQKIAGRLHHQPVRRIVGADGFGALRLKMLKYDSSTP